MDLTYRPHMHYYVVYDAEAGDWSVRERQTPEHSFSSWRHEWDADLDAKSRNFTAIIARVMRLEVMHQ